MWNTVAREPIKEKEKKKRKYVSYQISEVIKQNVLLFKQMFKIPSYVNWKYLTNILTKFQINRPNLRHPLENFSFHTLLFKFINKMCHSVFDECKILKSYEFPWEIIMTRKEMLYVFRMNEAHWSKNYAAKTRYLANIPKKYPPDRTLFLVAVIAAHKD